MSLRDPDLSKAEAEARHYGQLATDPYAVKQAPTPLGGTPIHQRIREHIQNLDQATYMLAEAREAHGTATATLKKATMNYDQIAGALENLLREFRHGEPEAEDR